MFGASVATVYGVLKLFNVVDAALTLSVAPPNYESAGVDLL
jgi:hypothetical protein